MNDSNVSPIRPNRLKVIGDRSEAARQLVFDAQALVDVAASAHLAEADINQLSMARALELASRLLDKAAAQMAADQICQESRHA